MSSFDFDTVRERRGTDSQKWQKYAGRDVLPLWVADMDFKSPPAIIEALHRRVEHGIFGYARPLRSTVDAVVEAMEKRYGWQIEPSSIVWLPGLVVGLNVIAQAFAQAGEEVLTLAPVYPPFMTAPRHSSRVSVTVPWQHNAAAAGGRWEIDWAALDRAVTSNTRVFYLCNPHNPLARVWRREELVRLAAFCDRHNLLLCSDEIHCDLILDPALPHVPAALAAPELAHRTITLMAPSKTYNVPGLGTSFAIIPEPMRRARFIRATAGIVAEVTPLGFAACEAAYRDAEPWRQELLAYLRGNRDYLLETIAREFPRLQVEAPVEATYLMWLNVSRIRLQNPSLHFEQHGLGLSDGAMFGAAKGTHVRLNFGCPRSILGAAVERIRSAMDAL